MKGEQNLAGGPDQGAWLNLPEQGFNNVQSDFYWSSSTSAYYAYYTGVAWYVDMWGGVVGSYDKDDGYYVWPVHAGQP